MLKIKYLRIEFDAEIAQHEIPAFRGAIAQKVGQDAVLFHHHQPDNTLRYAYPLIQYKRIGSRPTIVCLGEGVENIHQFFEKRNWDIHISGRTIPLKVAKLDMHQHPLQVWNKTFDYSLSNWIALNQPSYQAYKKLKGLTAQVQFLEKKMIGNILSFAKGVNWHVEKDIICIITQLSSTQLVKVKDVSLMSFHIKFATNVSLPSWIGLGSNVSIGFGTVKRDKAIIQEE